nr:LIM binding protein [Hymenolepis microstoma]
MGYFGDAGYMERLGPTPPLTGPPSGGNPNCRMQSPVMSMSSGPGHLGPPQMHPGTMMLPVGASGGIPSGLPPGIHYAPHPSISDRSDHGVPMSQLSQQPSGGQLGGSTMMQQHHHGPPLPSQGGSVGGIPAMQMPPVHPLPSHNHPHHPMHSHPGHPPLPIHRGGFQPEFRIYELNKRLAQRADENDSQWWEAFASDFFDDDATITITVRFEDGLKHFSIGRTLIPRYFRSIIESGCNELYFNLRHTRESFHSPFLTLESDNANMVMSMTRPIPAHVIVDAQFTLGFTIDELMRIRTWTFQIRSHRELILRSMLGVQDPTMFDQLSKNITRTGIPATTLHFLRLCVILEPMQELMSRQKFQNISPRDCLRNIVMNRWKRMTTIPTQPTKTESNRQTNKRRKRKGSSANSETGGGRATKRKQSPVPMPPQNLGQSEILIVGEPTLMGGDFGEDDERMITRLENSQFDPAAAAALAAAQQQQQMSAVAAGGQMPISHHHQQQQPFSRPPSFPPPAFQSTASSPPSGMIYTGPPGPPYASSPVKQQHQSPLYGHPNSVPPSQQQQGLQQPNNPMSYGGGGGNPMMPASVPPHSGGRIMSPMGVGVGVSGGNPSTPLGGPNIGNTHMMFAPPNLPETDSGGGGPPPRSGSTSSLNTAGLQHQQPPTFPPPPPPQQTEARISPPSQNNGPTAPFQKSPKTAAGGSASPGGGNTSLQFPPTLTSPFDSTAGGRAPTPRMQQHQISDGSGPGSLGRSETPNNPPRNGDNSSESTVLTSTASSQSNGGSGGSGMINLPSSAPACQQQVPQCANTFFPDVDRAFMLTHQLTSSTTNDQSINPKFSSLGASEDLDGLAPPKLLPSDEVLIDQQTIVDSNLPVLSLPPTSSETTSTKSMLES